MAKNNMKEIANLFGLELEEEFKIKNLGDKVFKFTTEGVVGKFDCTTNYVASIALNNLLTGFFEIDKPILTEQEKEYLSNVIKPFRDRVCDIQKRGYYHNKRYEYLVITYDNESKNILALEFPTFEEDTMYKGMEQYKKYTLEELGL